jgi:O-antigen ligase
VLRERIIAIALRVVLPILALMLCLFGGSVALRAGGISDALRRDVLPAFQEAKTQWVIFLCAAAYFSVFILLRRSSATWSRWKRRDADLWIVFVWLLGAVEYACAYSSASHSTEALVFLIGAALGIGVGVSAVRERPLGNCDRAAKWIIIALVVMLSLGSPWHSVANHLFQYRNDVRWTGLWENPNTYGLLMGTGVTLASGMAFLGWRVGVVRFVAGSVCFLLLGLMARGLLHSYSRGAWVGAVCGLAYLAVYGFSGFRLQEVAARQSWISRVKKCWRPLSVVLLSTLILAFWHFRETNWHPARRAFSAANTADFSWRNRIAAWKGALQIAAEHPFLGMAWGQPEPLYEHYYLPPKLTERGAFEMNDILMLGATLGIPALFCFGMYLWLSLKGKAESGKQKLEIQHREWLRPVCHAGAIVLLIGFWFDGGLFKLPTAATFWILLELGNVGTRETSEALNHE